MTLISSRDLRQRLRELMPPEAFEPVPVRGLAAFATFGFAVSIAVAVVATDLWWPIDAALSIVIGLSIVSTGLCAHEASHGAIFRSALMRQLLVWVGFGPFLVTPGLWTAWHVRAHHRGTNQLKYDPDMLSGHDHFESMFAHRFRTNLFPGSGTLASWVAPAFLFTLEGQYFLWVATGRAPLAGNVKMSRPWLMLTSALWIAAWATLAFVLGPLDALWVLVLPLMVGNTILMSYISTQHWIRPRVDADDPVATTLSVEVPRWVDAMHYQFSYHQEHHLFPSMSCKWAPLLREKVQQIDPNAVAALPWRTAMRAVFEAPVLYGDDRSLVDQRGRSRLDLDRLAGELSVPTRRRA
ncbi:MAG: fatty acid desaturase [Deltaproteobacteria bacterium]